jgi:hypothetical protein
MTRMTINSLFSSLSPETVAKYVVEVDVGPHWVCFKDPQYAAESVSLREGRFNEAGEGCYYLASGVECAKAEVPNWINRQLFTVNPHKINAFDAQKYAEENGVQDDFLKAKESGGYALCQSIAKQLSDVGCTGVLYNSFQAYKNGDHGLCMALRPNSGELVSDTYFIKT